MQEEREATISLVEVLAYLVRSLKLVIILMIICAIALGGFKVYSEINRIKNEEIRAYEVIDIDQYKDRLETLVLDRNQKVDYANNSLYLHLDPYNVSVTTVIMRVAVPEMTYTEGYPKSDDTRIEEIVNRIVANWDSLDLAVTLELPSYQGVESKFIKEMITVSGQDDMIIITGMGDTSERSQELTDAAYKYINDNKNTILAGKESCTISVISTETKTDINKDVLTAQNNYNTEMTNTDKAIDDLKKKVDELQSTIDSGKAKVKDDNISIVSIIKQAIIGAVVGLVLACIIVFCRFVFGKKVGASKVLEENSGLSYLGNLNTTSKGVNKLADKITGEYTWKSKDLALEYIVENISVVFGNSDCKKILISSSLMIEEGAPELAEALKKAGYEVEEAYDLTHNPAALAKLKNSDGLVLLEKPYVSKTNVIGDACGIANNTDVSSAGFVLI